MGRPPRGHLAYTNTLTTYLGLKLTYFAKPKTPSTETLITLVLNKSGQSVEVSRQLLAP